jgi:hypothetical protein
MAFNYAAGIFYALPSLRELVVNRTADTISLRTGIDLQVRPASFRGVRGLTAVAVLIYREFCDPSRSASDAMTLAIGHLDTSGGGRILTLDAVRERMSPFSPRGSLPSSRTYAEAIPACLRRYPDRSSRKGSLSSYRLSDFEERHTYASMASGGVPNG